MQGDRPTGSFTANRGRPPVPMCTDGPCRPERAHQSAAVRSSNPPAATIAYTGHP